MEIIRHDKLCFRCLFSSHSIKNCKSRMKCFRCQSIKHTAICNYEKQGERNREPPQQQQQSQDARTDTSLLVAEPTKTVSVILQTASAVAADNYERKTKKVRILLDPGSQRTYITNNLAKNLSLKPTRSQDVVIKTFGNDVCKQMNVCEYPFCVRGENGTNLYFKGLGVPVVCTSLSGQRIDVAEESFQFLKGVNICNVQSDESSEIDILIGSDYYWTVVNGEIKRSTENGLVAVRSKLGWIFSGPIEEGLEEITAANLITHVMKVEIEVGNDCELTKKIDKFWELDSIGVMPNERSVYDKFVDKIELKDGRYQVRLPFKESCSFIEDNYRLSFNRLMKLKSKLSSQPEVLKEYNDVISKQMQLGIIEKVESPGEVGRVTYLPHRAVIREDKQTTKLRVVFDASARNKGPSLNECLYKGPCLNPLLFDMLIRFRIHNIAITADIQQAFLQISVHPDERDFLRFLWFDDVFKEKPEVIKYRFNRVIFGATCSQFLLNGAIKIHLEQFKQQDPEFTEKMSKCFYVDDLNTGVASVKEGMILVEKLKSRFAEIKMNLCKWRTNADDLRGSISDETPSATDEPKKVLGIKWDEFADELVIDMKDFVPEVTGDSVTKRQVLSTVASFYDPIGYIQPIVIKLKIFFQEVCNGGYGWDEVLRQEHINKWKVIIEEMNRVQVTRIPRCYSLQDINDPYTSVELIGFSDASLVAYGCCIYFKFVTRNGDIRTSFITSKSRVAPLKRKETIPRLELLGNLLLSRLVPNVLKSVEGELKIDKISCFTDSQISLAWIKAENKEFKTFVQNRVIEIRQNVTAENWFYCKTGDNPADLVTRLQGDGIRSDLWWSGPEFVKSTENFGNPNLRLPEQLESDFEKEIKKIDVTMLITTAIETVDNIIDIQKYSDLLRLYRVTALVIRFCRNLKAMRSKQKQEIIKSKYLIAVEIKAARKVWIQANQRVLVASLEYKRIETQLNCKADDEGLIRTYGRMKNANLTAEAKQPVLLSKDHRLCILILMYCHLKVMHRGVKQTLTELRAGYWVTRGRSFTKKILFPCTLCKRLNGRPYVYPSHSDLPTLRFDDRAPFASTGCDYLGPLHVLPIYGKEKGNKTYKAYVVLYTCAATRGVILEVVNSANTKNFLQSLRRFISRRGCPSLMLSDQGSSFVAEETQEFAANRFIDWKFNVACAPWWGGMWERLVSCVKRCLKKTIGTKQLNYTELQTLVLEIELILNNRPLCSDYDDDIDDVLSPNHLIFGRRLESSNLREQVHEIEDNEDLSKRESHLKNMQNHFWDIWRKEYLTSLREGHRCSKTKGTETIKVDDVIIVYDRHQPRHLWKLGRVTELIRGNDMVVRAAKVKSGTSGAIITRPLNKLYPLEITGDERRKSDLNMKSDEIQVKEARPKRNSAIVADLKIKYGSGD